MTGTEVDNLKEAADAEAWERLNATPEIDRAAQARAVDLLKEAIRLLVQVESCLDDAAGELEETPDENRIVSLKDGTEELETYLRLQVERMC